MAYLEIVQWYHEIRLIDLATFEPHFRTWKAMHLDSAQIILSIV